MDTGDFSIPLPDWIAAKLGFSEEKKLVFGIRPEDMYERGPGQEPSIERPIIRAKVNVVEPLGKEISLDVSTGAHSLTVLLGAETKARPHHDIDLTINMDKAHLFRREGGEAIV
jgi:multiple sugar transport system ATP-binding protein